MWKCTEVIQNSILQTEGHHIKHAPLCGYNAFYFMYTDVSVDNMGNISCFWTLMTTKRYYWHSLLLASLPLHHRNSELFAEKEVSMHKIPGSQWFKWESQGCINLEIVDKRLCVCVIKPQRTPGNAGGSPILTGDINLPLGLGHCNCVLSLCT